MFYTLFSRLLVSPNTIFVTDHTTAYFVNVLPDWLIVILSLECYIVICNDWLYVHFTALCFSHVEVRFDISVIKELIDWLIGPVQLRYMAAVYRKCTRRPCTETHPIYIIIDSLFIFLCFQTPPRRRIVRRRNLARRRVTTMCKTSVGFYPRDAMLARVIEIATCLSVRPSVCPSVRPSVRPSRAGIVSKRRMLAAWFLHHLVAPRL